MSEQLIVKERDEVIVRFSGDSGDGMQLAGNIFSTISATVGNDICTFPTTPQISAPRKVALRAYRDSKYILVPSVSIHPATCATCWWR